MAPFERKKKVRSKRAGSQVRCPLVVPCVHRWAPGCRTHTTRWAHDLVLRSDQSVRARSNLDYAWKDFDGGTCKNGTFLSDRGTEPSGFI
jgi:hypothetical protein